MRWFTIPAVICVAAIGVAISAAPYAPPTPTPPVGIVGPPGAPDTMSVEDFLLDVSQLSGKVVSVRGVALCLGADLCYLYSGVTNLMQGTSFDPKALSRDVRKRLLDCSAMLHYCSIVVTGRVNAQAMMTPLAAQRIYW